MDRFVKYILEDLSREDVEIKITAWMSFAMTHGCPMESKGVRP